MCKRQVKHLFQTWFCGHPIPNILYSQEQYSVGALAGRLCGIGLHSLHMYLWVTSIKAVQSGQTQCPLLTVTLSSSLTHKDIYFHHALDQNRTQLYEFQVSPCDTTELFYRNVQTLHYQSRFAQMPSKEFQKHLDLYFSKIK